MGPTRRDVWRGVVGEGNGGQLETGRGLHVHLTSLGIVDERDGRIAQALRGSSSCGDGGSFVCIEFRHEGTVPGCAGALHRPRLAWSTGEPTAALAVGKKPLARLAVGTRGGEGEPCLSVGAGEEALNLFLGLVDVYVGLRVGLVAEG